MLRCTFINKSLLCYPQLDIYDYISSPNVLFIDEEVHESPIEQVRLTVPTTDDPTMPCLTFRTWVLGLVSCSLLAFLNQFFGYRQNPLYVSSLSAQIVVLPLGKLMASTLPTKSVRVRVLGRNWSFSLNPGPFNIKEHVLITIFANSGSNPVYALGIVTIIKAFYRRSIHPLAALLLSQTTQVIHSSWNILMISLIPNNPRLSLFGGLWLTADAWIWICGAFQEVSRRFAVYVVACQLGSSLPLQVDFFFHSI